MKPDQSENAIVIGAGLSGLAVAKELRAKGIPVTLLEQSDRIAAPWRARHPQLRLNIHRRFTRLPGHALIRDSNTFVRKNAVVEYLSDYADGLDAPIRFETRVLSVRREDRGWHVETDKGDYHCSHLIIATGRERVKVVPVWPGMDDFAGTVIHAADFADPGDYDGKKVLVIGAGNSGTDVLNHLSRANPAQVWVSVRHGPAILPSRIFGFPLHRLANLFACFPKWSLDPVFAVMQRVFLGDLRRFGLRRHALGGGTRMLKHGVTFALDDGFVAALKAGRFEAVEETVGFTPDAVALSDGRKIQPDVVICATGYRPGLEQVFDYLGALDANGYPLHPMGQADVNNPGLWFTGYGVIFQGFFHAAAISGTRIATTIAAQIALKTSSAPTSSSSFSGKSRKFICAVTGSAIVLAMVSGLVSALAETPRASPPPAPLTDEDFLYQGAPPDALFELGRNLFFDPILSGNRNISCGTCHDPARGTSDGVALSIGEGGTGFGPDRRTADGVLDRIPRNAQALWNIGAKEYRSMFHDGRVEPDPLSTFRSGFWSPARKHLPRGLDSLLAAQAMFPVLSASEMAGQKGENPIATAVAEDRVTDAWDLLAARLAKTPRYRALFETAFPGPREITLVQAANALAAFQSRAFRSHDSPFDRYIAGNLSALEAPALAGMELFYGKAGCAACHSGPLLSDHEFHAIAVPQIGPGKGHGADTGHWRASGFKARLEDEGRYKVSFEARDLFAFRTPSLRNVALTGPWGHDGALDDLEAMVRHHLGTVASLEAFRPEAATLLPLDKVIEQTGNGSELIFRPLNPERRPAFDLRDGWIHGSPDLRCRITAANVLAPVALQEDEVGTLLAFLNALTDPTAVDRSDLVPAQVPSGLTPQPSAAQGTKPEG